MHVCVMHEKQKTNYFPESGDNRTRKQQAYPRGLDIISVHHHKNKKKSCYLCFSTFMAFLLTRTYVQVCISDVVVLSLLGYYAHASAPILKGLYVPLKLSTAGLTLCL